MKTERHEFLRAMVRAYLECAIWSGHDWDDMDDSDNPEPLDTHYSIDDVSWACYRRAVADCKGFMDDANLVAHDWTAEQFGHDFSLTRNGHGAGFWDRGRGSIGDQLTTLCRPYGSADLCVINNKLEWM